MLKGKHNFYHKFKPEYFEKYPDNIERVVSNGQIQWTLKDGKSKHFLEFTQKLIWQARTEEKWSRMLECCHNRRKTKPRTLEQCRRSRYRSSEYLKSERRAENIAKNKRNLESSKKRRAATEIYKHKLAEQIAVNAQRKEAQKEKSEFLQQWKEKYGHLYSRENKRKRERIHEERRREIIRSTTCEEGIWDYLNKINYGSVICYWCKIKLPFGGEADHVIPLSRGGKHIISNIVPSCPKCNNKKRAKLPSEIEFIQSQLVML